MRKLIFAFLLGIILMLMIIFVYIAKMNWQYYLSLQDSYTILQEKVNQLEKKK